MLGRFQQYLMRGLTPKQQPCLKVTSLSLVEAEHNSTRGFLLKVAKEKATSRRRNFDLDVCPEWVESERGSLYLLEKDYGYCYEKNRLNFFLPPPAGELQFFFKTGRADGQVSEHLCHIDLLLSGESDDVLRIIYQLVYCRILKLQSLSSLEDMPHSQLLWRLQKPQVLGMEMHSAEQSSISVKIRAQCTQQLLLQETVSPVPVLIDTVMIDTCNTALDKASIKI